MKKICILTQQASRSYKKYLSHAEKIWLHYYYYYYFSLDFFFLNFLSVCIFRAMPVAPIQFNIFPHSHIIMRCFTQNSSCCLLSIKSWIGFFSFFFLLSNFLKGTWSSLVVSSDQHLCECIRCIIVFVYSLLIYAIQRYFTLQWFRLRFCSEKYPFENFWRWYGWECECSVARWFRDLFGFVKCWRNSPKG